jgi:hypothetical protein
MIRNGIMISQEEAEMLLKAINYFPSDKLWEIGKHEPELLTFLGDFRVMVRDGKED